MLTAPKLKRAAREPPPLASIPHGEANPELNMSYKKEDDLNTVERQDVGTDRKN